MAALYKEHKRTFALIPILRKGDMQVRSAGANGATIQICPAYQTDGREDVATHSIELSREEVWKIACALVSALRP